MPDPTTILTPLQLGTVLHSQELGYGFVVSLDDQGDAKIQMDRGAWVHLRAATNYTEAAFRVVAVPVMDWPRIQVPTRVDLGELTEVVFGRKLLKYEEWFLMPIRGTGGDLYIAPSLAPALGECLTLTHAKGYRHHTVPRAPEIRSVQLALQEAKERQKAHNSTAYARARRGL